MQSVSLVAMLIFTHWT